MSAKRWRSILLATTRNPPANPITLPIRLHQNMGIPKKKWHTLSEAPENHQLSQAWKEVMLITVSPQVLPKFILPPLQKPFHLIPTVYSPRGAADYESLKNWWWAGLYSPEFLEGLFSEVRRHGVLRSSRRLLAGGIIPTVE